MQKITGDAKKDIDMKYHVIILREDLEIHYCDPITLDTVKCVRFRTLEDLEEYLYDSAN